MNLYGGAVAGAAAADIETLAPEPDDLPLQLSRLRRGRHGGDAYDGKGQRAPNVRLPQRLPHGGPSSASHRDPGAVTRVSVSRRLGTGDQGLINAP
ncbi:hypothetical protein GCM10012286_81240 [Streptomyces lasiicapitis]|uniref:Uncharacterized protein n=1 Tax=Streptomyces lasiicapitis TaxID=1923961 RepID=A0ABQ2MX39_9ACTN|nr:hypothetical protein GCM10012286_81240 [Streptomyces lasiicapitis]